MTHCARAGVVAVVAVGLLSCKSSTTAPTSTSSTTTTTSIPAQTGFIMSGQIIDDETRRGVPSADVDVVQGVNQGRAFRTDPDGMYSARLDPGSFVVRVRANGYAPRDFPVTLSGDQ